MGFLKTFEKDNTLVQNGVWVTVCANEDGTRFEVLVARKHSTNKRWRNRMSALVNGKTQLELEAMDETVGREQLAKATVGSLLLNWRGLKPTGQGDEVAFSDDVAVQYLIDYPDFYDAVHSIADDGDRYATQYSESVEKN